MIFVLAGAIVGIALCASVYLPRKYGTIRVARLIRLYRESPNEAIAAELGRLLQYGEVPEDDGNRILRALIEPTLLKRESYPAKGAGNIAIVCPRRVPLENAQVAEDVRLVYPDPEKKGVGWAYSDGFPNGIEKRHKIMLLTGGTGRFDVAARLSYTVRPRKMKGIWVWEKRAFLPFRLPRKHMVMTQDYEDFSYECSVEVPVRVSVVPCGQEETPQCVRSAELDVAMKAAVETTPRAANEGRWTNGGRVFSYREEIIMVSPLPENCAFDVFIRGAGSTQEIKRCTEVWLKGESMRFHSFPFIDTDDVGQHSATLILRAQPSAAQNWPEVKQVWGGSLEIPVNYEILEIEPAPGADEEP